MTDDGWEGIGEVPEGRPKEHQFTVIQGGKDLDAKRTEVRKAIKDFTAVFNRSFHTPSGAAKIIKEAVYAALPREEIDDFIEWCGNGKANITTKANLNRYREEAVVDLKNQKRHELMLQGDWKVHLKFTPDGRTMLSTAENISLFLQNDPAFRGYFRYDEFRDQVIVVDRPPWLSPNLLGRTGSPQLGWYLNDTIITSLQIQIQSRGPNHVRDTDVDKCLASVAKDFRYNSLTSWLDSLNWHGASQLNSWLIKYCGAEDSLYSRLAGRWWLMSAVARAYNPGCKADYVLLLESPQGYKKSTLWMTVARRKEWYLEYTDDLNTADGRKQLRGKWIVALPELSVLNTKEVRQVKAFVTRQMENVRDIFEKYHRDHERSLVLCGDTNDSQYFSDPTGNRRYWPIKCERIDIAGLDMVMDQLWAEAVYWYKNGVGGEGIWWPEIDQSAGVDYATGDVCREFNRQQEAIVEDRYKQDPWESEVISYLRKGLTEGREVDKLCGGTKLCQMILGLSVKDVGQFEATRMGNILKRLGYHKQSVRLNGEVLTGFQFNRDRSVVRWR